MTTASNSRPVEGILWTFGAGILFVGVNVFVKLLGPVMPAAQMAFIRYGLGLALLIPTFRVIARMRLTRRQWGLFAIRGGWLTAMEALIVVLVMLFGIGGAAARRLLG